MVAVTFDTFSDEAGWQRVFQDTDSSCRVCLCRLAENDLKACIRSLSCLQRATLKACYSESFDEEKKTLVSNSPEYIF